MRRLYEKKDHLIMRNPNLTDEQKQEIIELLGKHPSYENKIDWNKNKSLTYEDFMSVLRPLYLNDLDPRGLIEGEDYDIIYEFNDEVLYSIYTYDASRILASNAVEPEIWTPIPSWCGREEFTDEAHAFGYFDSEHGDMKPGAKWCISMQTSTKYWNGYSPDFHFLFWFRNDDSLGDDRKIAISISKKTWEISTVYNGADDKIEMELPSYIMEAINNKKKSYKEKEINRLKSMFTLNPQTNRYDYDEDLDKDKLNILVSEDKDGFIINFGKITGYFDCSDLDLVSLKGAPTEVGRDFYCHSNRLTSLKGAPHKVGRSFYCYNNQLTSLKGAPQKIDRDFFCFSNQITSLEGAPQIVGGAFYCNDNYLTSLKGAPQKIGRGFSCYDNQLTSLEGAPQKVGEWFNCSNNRLISLKGAPQTLNRGFDCSNNKLTSLEGAPQTVGGSFECNNNQLTSLEGTPQKVGRDFSCQNNKLTSLKGAPQEIDGSFYCYNNQLTSLKGAPQTINGWFDCRGNSNLHSLDGIGEVKGKIIKGF